MGFVENGRQGEEKMEKRHAVVPRTTAETSIKPCEHRGLNGPSSVARLLHSSLRRGCRRRLASLSICGDHGSTAVPVRISIE